MSRQVRRTESVKKEFVVVSAEYGKVVKSSNGKFGLLCAETCTPPDSTDKSEGKDIGTC